MEDHPHQGHLSNSPQASQSGTFADLQYAWPSVGGDEDETWSTVPHLVRDAPSTLGLGMQANNAENIDLSVESRQPPSPPNLFQGGSRASVPAMSATAQSRAATDADTGVPKQITYLIALTDQVLTKRTQMEHEEETLYRHQTYLNESSHSLLNAFTDLLPRIDHDVGTRKRADHAQRSSDGPKPSAAMPTTPPPPPRQINHDTLELAPTKSDIVSQPIGDIEATPTPPDPIDVLWTHYRKYQSDYEVLNLRRARLTGLRTELTTLEFRLRKRQDEFLLALNSMVSVMPEFGSQVLADASEAMGSFAPSEKSKSDTPSLLAMYFDRKGDIGIFRDRLLELEYYFHEGLVERELMLDRGDELDITNAQYEADYARNRENIEKDLQAAEQDAVRLAAKCREAGIDINNTTRIASSSSEDIDGRSLAIMESAARDVNSLPPSTAMHLTTGRQNTDRIEGWLDSVSTGTDLLHDHESPYASRTGNLVTKEAPESSNLLGSNGVSQQDAGETPVPHPFETPAASDT